MKLISPNADWCASEDSPGEAEAEPSFTLCSALMSRLFPPHSPTRAASKQSGISSSFHVTRKICHGLRYTGHIKG